MIIINLNKFEKEEIIYKKEKIKLELQKRSLNIKENRIINITPLDLNILFNLYDRYFFENQFKNNDMQINFSISNRMTRAAGKTLCTYSKNKIVQKIEIRMSVDFFKKYDYVSREKRVCGIETKDAVDAFMIVFEHELVHVLEFLNFKSSNCRGSRFKEIAKMIFMHEESYHELPTTREIAKERFNVQIGDKVAFKYKGSLQIGILYKINKNAVVMVKDKNGQYGDGAGNRFTKWYVPLELLVKSS